MVTTMARNGTEFGIRISGLGTRWFTAPAEMVKGLIFPGFTEEDANPDIGDSAITETAGIDDNGNYTGVEAVIDKDLAGQQLARDVGAETFVILTGVSHVAINYGKESQKELDTITVSEGRRYQQEGHFPPGSMGPKMEAALLFVENGGHKSIITSPE